LLKYTIRRTKMLNNTNTHNMASYSKRVEIKIPDKVFFSNDPVHYTVKNDFYITVSAFTGLNELYCAKRGGETYPAIYIKGFEKLFKDDGTQYEKLDSFFKMFTTNGNNDWSISYGKNPDGDYCAIITTAALPEEMSFPIGFQLSDRCAFTEIPDAASPIELTAYAEGFFEEQPVQTLVLERGFAAYIEKFGAYEDISSQTTVNAVYKGKSCYISWKIEDNEKAAAFLYDENGAVVANLPPYTAKIDRDRRFSLNAYNDFCSVTESVTVYRTLWEKKETLSDCPFATDAQGCFKIHNINRSTALYYLYVHPKLYTSSDLKSWSLYSENTSAPSGFEYYSTSCTDERFGVCYLNEGQFIYCEMSLEDKIWKKSEAKDKISGLICAQAQLADPDKTYIMLASNDELAISEFNDGGFFNTMFLPLPSGANIKSADLLTDKKNVYLAALFDNNRVYFYDLNDDFKDNIFECPDVKGDSIYLVKSNAVYIVLDGYVFEVSDREKFSDTHFFPEYKGTGHPIIGAADNETIAGIFETEQNRELWNYKF